MAVFPLPPTLLDVVISESCAYCAIPCAKEVDMKFSKKAARGEIAAILHHHHNGDAKTLTIQHVLTRIYHRKIA